MMSADMKETLAACHDCDALYRRVPLRPGEQARCIRCNAVLYRTSRIGPDTMLAIVLTALITFVIANVFPIVELSVQGITSSSTLIGSVHALWGDKREIVATLVLATTLMVPLLDMLIMALLTSLALMHRRPPYFAPLLRLVQTGEVESITGRSVPVQADSICVHGDSPGAVEMARRIRARLEQAGVALHPFVD